MNLNFFEVLGFISDVLNTFGSDSSFSNEDYDEKPKLKNKTKYLIEKISATFLIIASVLLLFIFKDPLPPENYIQTIVVASLIGFAISLLFFFFLYVIEIYYFKNVFQWLFFSCSVILFFVSVVFGVYFRSGIFV